MNYPASTGGGNLSQQITRLECDQVACGAVEVRENLPEGSSPKRRFKPSLPPTIEGPRTEPFAACTTLRGTRAFARHRPQITAIEPTRCAVRKISARERARAHG